MSDKNLNLNLDGLDSEELDLFADELEERYNAAGTSCFASGGSVSTVFASAPGCLCTFACLGSACTSS